MYILVKRDKTVILNVITFTNKRKMYFYKSSINMYLPLTASVLLHGELLNFFSNFDYFLTANGTLIIYYYENLKDLWGFLWFFLKTILI